MPDLNPRLAVVGMVAAVALSLGATAPADARRVTIYNCGPDGTCTQKTVCRQQLPNGNTVDYEDGTQVTVNLTDGTQRKFTCRNGEWVETAKLTTPLPGFRGGGIGARFGVGELKGTMQLPNVCDPVVLFCPPTVEVPVGPPGQITLSTG